MPPVYERIPFEECIGEPLLLKKAFDACSPPQRMILKSIYGLELTKAELVYWSAFNGLGIYDELGYLTGTHGDYPYTPGFEAEDITLIVGRRSGKTSKVASFIVVYEALAGGHKAHVGSDKQDPICLQVSQDLETSKASIRQFILETLESSPIGKRELEFKSAGSAVTADRIRLRQGLIICGPPTIKLRGQAIAVCAMDELAVWPKDRESANPDYEVEAAVKPAMMQFPQRKLVKCSTPWTKEGLLWTAKETGTGGRFLDNTTKREAHARTIVLCAPTAALENPNTSRSFLTKEKAKDPDTYRREFLAEFADSKSGFLNRALLEGATDKGVTQRSPRPGMQYIGTLDPAFRRDKFTFCIGHLEGGAFYQDWIQSWQGTPEFPLRPGLVLKEIATTCSAYSIRMVTSDQHHSDSLIELGQGVGLIINSNPYDNALKSKMWGDFNSYLQQQKLHLLDHPEMLDELAKMEKKLTQFGNVQYYGTRDDLAVVTALNIHTCLQWGERKPTAAPVVESLSTQVRERMQKATSEARGGGQQWWNQ